MSPTNLESCIIPFHQRDQSFYAIGQRRAKRLLISSSELERSGCLNSVITSQGNMYPRGKLLTHDSLGNSHPSPHVVLGNSPFDLVNLCSPDIKKRFCYLWRQTRNDLRRNNPNLP